MNATVRPVGAVLLLVVLIVACSDDSASLDRAGTSPASFDWTMPDRFGHDRDGDGLVDYPRATVELQPSSWTVRFDACDLEADRYHWYVDRRPVARVTSCEYEHEFSAEGEYDVLLHALSTPGSSVRVEETVTVQDWLIVSFGDSYASGEGVPEVSASTSELRDKIQDRFERLRNARVRDSLEDILGEDGPAGDLLEKARDRRDDFLASCDDVDDWDDVKACANFLGDLAFDTYDAAKAFFDEGVDYARIALTLEIELAGLAEDFEAVKWQEPLDADIENWDHDCHRSANAAPALAARAIEDADPRTSVTFVHLACTGARVNQYSGNVVDQIRWANALLGDREIDAALLSVGGNDAGFADLAAACAMQARCHVENVLEANSGQELCYLMSRVGLKDPCDDMFENPPKSGKTLLEDGLALLPDRYELLATDHFPTLRGLLAPEAGGPGRNGRGRPTETVAPEERVRSDRVYVSEYVDMTKDDAFNYCWFDRTDPLGTMPGFTVPEMTWLDHTAGREINAAVADAAREHGWTYVSDIYDAYAPHGYCAEDHWVVRAHESLLTQAGAAGAYKGVAHPNIGGHQHNGTQISAALQRDLYPEGADGPPRAPDARREPIQSGPWR